MSFCDFLERELIDHVLGGATPANVYSPPATLYIGLSRTSVTTFTDAGTGYSEPPGNGYARVAVANTTTNWSAATGTPTVKTNATAITFPTATGAWGTITYFFIADAASGGNILMKGQLTTSKSVANGDTLTFAAGDIIVQLD